MVVGGGQAGLAIAYLLTRQEPRLTTQPNIRTKITIQHHIETAPPDHFPTDTTGLPACGRPEIVELADGDMLDLEICPVVKQLGDATVRMLSYNGSIPGPTLKVAHGSEVDVNVINRGDLEATVHHRLRLENRYDGTHETQAPNPSPRASRHA